MSIIIRLLQKGEEKLANEAFNIGNNRSRPLENFIWEFVSPPAGPAIYVVAVDTTKSGNPIIGTQCAIPILLTDNNGNQVLTAKSEDTLVDAAYRGQKLFDKMYELLFSECIKAGIKVIWGFTPARKPFLKIGFEIPANTLQGILVNDIYKATKHLRKLNPEGNSRQMFQLAGLSTLSKLNKIRYSLNNSTLPVGLTCDEKFISNKSEFIPPAISIKGTTTYDLFQSAEYSEWRFMKNPFNNEYWELNYYKSGKWAASILANFRPEGFAYIEQMYFDPAVLYDDKIVIVRNAVAKILKKGNPFFIRFLGFDENPLNKEELQLLKKAGFLFVKRSLAIVWKSCLPLENGNFIDFNQVHFSRTYTQGHM